MCALLRRKGVEILDTNWHGTYGELDIVAAAATEVVFIEVKTRRSARYAEAKEAVTWTKRKRLFFTAEEWMMAHPSEERQPRFDVAEVYITKEKYKLNYHPNAFDGSDIE